MNPGPVALALALLPTIGFSQSQSTDRVGECERLVLARADAPSNPSREFSLGRDHIPAQAAALKCAITP